jgi:hypothetical protein
VFRSLLMPLLVASCAAAPQAPRAELSATSPIRTCNAAAAQHLVGRAADATTLDEAKRLAGAIEVRLLKPHIPRAMNFRSGRLNVSVDRTGQILELSCG